MTNDVEDKEGAFWGNFVLVVIAIGFLAGAVPMGKMAFGPLVSSFMAMGWERGEAVIVTSVVEVPHRRQYSLNAEYRYQWDGTEYVSNQVFFDEMVGVRRLYYHAVSRELLRHADPSNPIDIWVNPDVPSQSVIYRQVRWDKFAGNVLLFSIWGVITAVLIGSVLAVLRPGID